MLFDLVKVPAHFTGEKYTKKEFWDKYVNIDSSNYSSLNEINDFGASWGSAKLFELQKQEMRKNESSFKNISSVNAFLNAINNTNLTAQNNEVGEASASAILGRIIELSNAVFISSKLNPKNLTTHKTGKGKRSYNEGVNRDNYKGIEDKASENLIKEYRCLYEVLGAYDPTQRGILYDRYQAILTKGFAKILRKKEDYIQDKAFEAEQLIDNNSVMKNILSNLGLRSLQTADFIGKDKKKMIQDTMIFSEKDLNKKFKDSFIFTANNINYAVQSLQEMITTIDEIKRETQGSQITIKLSDELTAEMERIQQFSIQTKSAIENNALINKSGEGGRNSISLNELLEDTKTYRRHLELLFSLNEEYWTNTKTTVFQKGEKSEDLEALTNYLLSKSIGKTNMSKNQLYLTTLGITIASQWMEIRNRMLKFNPAIKKLMRGDKITDPHSYYFDIP